MQYITDLECPVNSERKEQVLDWLLGHAIRLEYADKGLNFTCIPAWKVCKMRT